jgi:hypothetical protein
MRGGKCFIIRSAFWFAVKLVFFVIFGSGFLPLPLTVWAVFLKNLGAALSA